MTPTPPAGAEPSPEAAIVIALMEYDNMDFNDEEQHYHDRRIRTVSDILAPFRARIGELEKERDVWKLAYDIQQPLIKDLSENAKAERAYADEQSANAISLSKQLALANAKAEEARRAGVKCFDESHPDTSPNAS